MRLFLLKSFDARAAAPPVGNDGWRLPYAIDSLARAGVELEYSDAVHTRFWRWRPLRRVIRRLERLSTPFLQTLLATRRIARADVTVALFESQGNFLAWLRSMRIWPYTRPRFAVLATWLAHDAPSFGRFRLRWYRRAYRGVDRLIYFSRNQTVVYRDLLGITGERLAWVPFGVDHQYFAPADVPEDDYVVAVGRDRGRDWRTLFAAVRGTHLKVKLACREEDIGGLVVPANVEVVGVLDRDVYRDLTARARVAVVPTEVRAYPTGQSVVLESMSMAKCCVVTETPAMSDYVVDGVNALLVPPGDAEALRAALEAAMSGAELRRRVGDAARQSVVEQFNAVRMWERIADILATAVDDPHDRAGSNR